MRPTFGVDYKVKKNFFDRPKVINRIGKQKARVLGRFGAFVRTEVRTKQLRRRKKVSEAGSPPSVHSKDSVATLKNVLFAMDGPDTVVIGPVALNQKTIVDGETTSGAVPGLLERGGTATILEKKVGDSWVRIGRRKPRPGQPTRRRVAHYAPRPYMGPALFAVAPKFPGLWANTVVE